ncbi:hypothetical protein AVEN_96295-1 [Araneus ventricosus]|uniref:Uncharacterized protein n=1 Tax=Araneus ventricosus TaxID=182803 RepID=A0A4Y2UF81_ARAVE|nr:hypothetical protein AVEN_96295-1 [Araneus ventricosus]
MGGVDKGHPSSTQGAAPILYNTEGTSSPQVNSEPKRSATIVPADNPSSKIMHPDEDLSLEEIRAQLPKYQMYLNMSRMPMSMMAGKMPMPGGNPMMMNGMMRPGTMAVPPECCFLDSSREGCKLLLPELPHFLGQVLHPQANPFTHPHSQKFTPEEAPVAPAIGPIKMNWANCNSLERLPLLGSLQISSLHLTPVTVPPLKHY